LTGLIGGYHHGEFCDETRGRAVAMGAASEVDRITEGLSSRFPRLDPATVAALVRAEFGRRSRAPVQDFVPLFVERSLKTRLRARFT
jgi:hypothetical protein